ncbi:WW domain-binding protein 4-like [Patiria miniata]|uniref:WW domain-binding protein 4 n=1 Tax=Patiria miniata TaxID=46514 RepID=A0A913ZW83_PATMI|nr:WW domain-binding protein 4-like [Patiria miniata]
MATYWKSQPKKHCDFCKCWIADNRASIDFHERGKRHKENVEKKLAELRKKGHEQYKIQQTLDSDLIKMETEALKAFKKDLENDPALAAQYKAQAASAAASAAATAKKKEELLNSARKLHKQGLVSTKQAGKTTATSSTSSTAPATEASSHTAESTAATTAAEGSKTTCVWLEGTSPEGHTYYWNTVTGESQWEKPEGYVATEESTIYKQQDPEDGTSQTQEQQEPAEETTKTSQDLKPPGTEDEKPEENDEEQKEDDSGNEDDEDEVEVEEEDDDEKDEDALRPVKRKMVNPYGGWTTIVPDDTPPIDLQLPQPDRPYFQPIVPQAAQHQPREKVKFKERTVSSLTSASQSSSSPLGSGVASFKKRKFGGGGRSIRQRDTDT